MILVDGAALALAALIGWSLRGAVEHHRRETLVADRVARILRLLDRTRGAAR